MPKRKGKIFFIWEGFKGKCLIFLLVGKGVTGNGLKYFDMG